MASEPRSDQEKITPNTLVTARMAHITEHPLRAKRRKLDDDSHPVPEVNFTSPAQLRELLVFQQNPATSKQG
jgi:nucleolar pre-ribosomal-associated protein 1